jgi:hypothetical protein
MRGQATDVRASDADRDAAVDALRAHLLAGRLTSAEFEERVERVYSATTRDELAEVTADLPATRPPRSVALEPQTTRRPRVPGQRAFAFGLIGLLFVRWDESQVVLSAREGEARTDGHRRLRGRSAQRASRDGRALELALESPAWRSTRAEPSPS